MISSSREITRRASESNISVFELHAVSNNGLAFAESFMAGIDGHITNATLPRRGLLKRSTAFPRTPVGLRLGPFATTSPEKFCERET